MISTRTVFVLGAGASEPYGFPSGSGLVDLAISKMQAKTRERGAVLEAVGCPAKDLKRFIGDLSRARPRSIDAFLEDRSDVMQIGKAVIAALLIPFESEANLPNEVKCRQWYHYLLDRMCPKSEFEQNKISILTFNYDRSLEHFLVYALMARFKLELSEAARLTKVLPFVHLYGSLGPLPEFNLKDPDRLYYNAGVAAGTVRQAAKSIRVIHEDGISSDPFVAGQELLRHAEQVWFLGFGYDPKNVERLDPRKLARFRRESLSLSGTAFGLLDGERFRAEKLVTQANGGRPNLTLGDFQEDILTFLRRRWL